VLAWGAVNALPTLGRTQVSFKIDYSGGWGTYRKDVWRTFKNTCGPYTGPKLAWSVTACTAKDGSHWAVQAWQRMLPNYGLVPSPKQAVWELRLSHWSGELPQLTVNLNWAYRKFDHIFGSFTYGGVPVHGFKSTSTGNPLDTWGRNLYVDTFNSAYGTGWKRENSFLMHKGTGTFCYGFYPHGSRPVGHGQRYRATIIGPGVTPDVMWQGQPLGSYNQALDCNASRSSGRCSRARLALQAALGPGRALRPVGSARRGRGGHLRHGRRVADTEQVWDEVWEQPSPTGGCSVPGAQQAMMGMS
jgi:hypothetical protein